MTTEVLMMMIMMNVVPISMLEKVLILMEELYRNKLMMEKMMEKMHLDSTLKYGIDMGLYMMWSYFLP
jgi:hypothetical protein